MSFSPATAMPATISAAALPRSLPRIAFIDSLRFIAAVAVLLQHSLEQQGPWGQYFVDMLSPGVFGVALFFCISGFVIPMATGRSFEIQKFFIRRIFRIYPLVIFCFVFIFLIDRLAVIQIPYAASASAWDWIANILLINEYVGVPSLHGVTWTLSLEFVWYVVFAISFVLWGARFDRLLIVVVPTFMILLAIASFLLERRLPLARLGMIYAAILGCRAYHHFKGDLKAPWFLLDAIIFIVVMALCNIVSFGYFRHPNITLMQALVPWIVASILFVTVVAIHQINSSRILNSYLLCWLGTLSYSIYLLHPFALDFANSYFPASLSLGVALIGTLLFSIAGYHLVELPGQALGRRLTARAATAA